MLDMAARRFAEVEQRGVGEFWVSADLRAFRLTNEQFRRLPQGDVVTVRATPSLGRVRFIVPATELGPYAVEPIAWARRGPCLSGRPRRSS